MARIGWLCDSHIDPFNETGAGERLTEDVVSLFEDHGISDLYFNGDAVAKGNPWNDDSYAHSVPEHYERFWELIDKSGYGDRVICIPGNHDVPLQYFLDSDDRARLSHKASYDGVTVLMVNTVAPGWVSGSRQTGYGWTNGYVPYRQLRWLDEELEAAGNDMKIVYFHHHAWLTPDDPLASAPTDSQSVEQLYWVCRNYRAIHQILSSYEKVICPQGHTAQFVAEGSSQVDGVEYLYKKHYYEVRDDGVTTYAYIDADENGCTVTTIDHNTKEETVILDKEY